MKTKLMNMALLGAVLLSAVACSDPGSIGAPQERSEVTLTLSVDVPTRSMCRLRPLAIPAHRIWRTPLLGRT